MHDAYCTNYELPLRQIYENYIIIIIRQIYENYMCDLLCKNLC